MDNWIFLLFFIFSILVCGRNIFLFISSLLSPDPDKYTLDSKELILLGVAVSYFLTFLIN
jgi:hypothetical protein